jgi:hypothetical protein
MRDERGLFHGVTPRSRRARLWWGSAAGVAIAVPGCALISDLAQFDGYGDGGVDAAPDVPDVTTTDTHVGIDAPGPEVVGMDVVDVADVSFDTNDAPVDGGGADEDADAEVVDVGVVEASDAAEGGGPLTAGLPCTPVWLDAGANVVTNPLFEEGGAGWGYIYGGAFSVITDGGSDCGLNAGELSARTAFYNAMATNIPLTPATYNVSAWVRQDGAMTVGMALGGVCMTADAGTNYPGGPTISVPPNTWTYLSGQIVVPSGCATMQFFVGQPQTAASPYPNLYAAEVYVGK